MQIANCYYVLLFFFSAGGSQPIVLQRKYALPNAGTYILFHNFSQHVYMSLVTVTRLCDCIGTIFIGFQIKRIN